MKKGIYLIINPSVEEEVLLNKLEQALEGGIIAVQIWDQFQTGGNYARLFQKIKALCVPKNIPLLINNKWEWLLEWDFDGVHFDVKPENMEFIKTKIGAGKLIGITCGNELSVLQWAEDHHLDYVSFCSVFPSSTANSCELVHFKTMQKAAAVSSIPIFLAGGIQPENMHLLAPINYTGIALVSGIMDAKYPKKRIEQYQQKLNF